MRSYKIDLKVWLNVAYGMLSLSLNLNSHQALHLVSNLVTADIPADTLPQLEIPAWLK